jgi:hypothetical protein
MKRLFVALATYTLFLPSVLAQSDIQAKALPALAEESWTFSDGGNTYFVGRATGSVIVVRGDQPKPPDDDIKPPPVIKKGVKWLSLVLDQADTQAASYRTDAQARSTLQKAGVNFRSYLTNESDVETLGFMSLVEKSGLPAVITQDKEGNVLSVKQVTSPADWTKIVEGALP